MKLFIPLLLSLTLFVNCAKDDDSTETTVDNETVTSVLPIDEIEDATDQETDGTDEVDNKDDVDDNDGNEGENESKPVELTVEQKRQIEEFNYRVFNKSRKNPNEYVRKWETDMKIYLSGSFSSNQKEIIKSFVDQLKGINSDFNIEITTNKSGFNTEIYASSAQQYIKDRPNFIPGFKPEGVYPSRTSNVLYEVASKKIYSSLIWIENPSDSFVRDVKREILFSLGLGATKDSTSILYSFSNEVSTLNEDDVFVVKTLFNSLIKPGLNEERVNEIINSNIDSFF